MRREGKNLQVLPGMYPGKPPIDNRNMRVFLLTIGDEILIGQIVDTNSAWMARQLNAIGAEVMGIVTVGDDPQSLIEALDRAMAKSDVVLMTGGLGPTRDDRTKGVLTEIFEDELFFHQPTYDRIVALFERRGRTPTEAHYRQAFMPRKATLITNEMGTAPGMWFERDQKVVVSMPGVPYEMKSLMEKEVLPRLQKKFIGRPLLHRTLLTAGEGESRIATRLEAFEDALPENVKLAYLPDLGKVRLRLTAFGEVEEEVRALLTQKAGELEALVPELVYGYDDDDLEATLGRMLRERGLSLGTAESCSGGYIAHSITTVPGSSDYFKGSVVAYSNEVKMNLLGVNSETLEREGAVSEATVSQMVRGALASLKCDVALSISGIAGPGGGTPEKPVGTIWLAVGNKDHVKTLRIHIGKKRILNIKYSSVIALNMLRQFILENYPVGKPSELT